MRLTKHHGLGNDFLVVLDESSSGAPPHPTADLARRLCDRHTGLGADGLVHGYRTEGADVGFGLWNADGSEAEVSGNGLRCLAQAVARARSLASATLAIEVGGQVRPAVVTATDDPATVDVDVEMGPVADGPPLPMEAAARLAGRAATADVGNPHLVVLVDDPATVDLAVEGPALESAFPAGVNIEFVRVDDPTTVEMVVWERGAGITQACGSGACAAVHVAHRWGMVGYRATVRMPGGVATVTLHPEGTRLAGPSTFVAEIEVPDG